MSTNNAHPKWWQVYLTFPLLIALFILDSHLKLSQHGHLATQIGILLLIYGLVHLWLKTNATALSELDQRQFHNTFTVIHLPPYQMSDAKNSKRSIFQLPHSEIKGTLSDTFEMETMDAEFISINETLQEITKE
jgi:hypothetical protein